MSNVATTDPVLPDSDIFKSRLRTVWAMWVQDVEGTYKRVARENKPRTLIEAFYLHEFVACYCEAQLVREWQNLIISAHTSKAQQEMLRSYDIRSQEFNSWMDALYEGQKPEDPQVAKLFESTQLMREMIDGEALHLSLPDLHILNQMRASAEARRDRALANFYNAVDRRTAARPLASENRNHHHARQAKSRKQGRGIVEPSQARRKQG
jgi:hypothetical protein